MTNKTFDVILAGGGLMGCAIAYYLLKADEQLQVAIIEMDPTYEKASTPLSDGNIRVQFNLKENIQISQYGMAQLENFAEEMAVEDEQPALNFRQQGNLFFVDEASRAEAERGLALQQSLNCPVEWWEPAEIVSRYPFLDLAGLVGGTFGVKDGSLDPWALLMGFKKKAVALGAEFIHAQVVEILQREGQVFGVALASGEQLNAKVVVNSAGAWAPLLARTVKVELPVQPVKRQVFVVETTLRPERTLPALFFPSGLYLFHERAGHFMVGKSLPDDPIGYEFSWNRQTFNEMLWPELVEFIPAFDRLKLAQGWAGLYAVNTLDGNAILGEWPTIQGFYLVTGFSGHGFQQCFAVGRYLTELILDKPPVLDLSVFSPQRILDNRPVFESGHRLI